MNIKLNEIFRLTKVEIENSRVELNMTDGTGGIAYIDKWLCRNVKKNITHFLPYL